MAPSPYHCNHHHKIPKKYSDPLSIGGNKYEYDAPLMSQIARSSSNSDTSFPLFMSSSSNGTSGSTATSTRKPKKTVRDRTNEEAASLIRDIIQAGVEAGPRAGVVRSLQAYYAVTSTLNDFLPISIPIIGQTRSQRQRNQGNEVEPFSAPVAVRKLFERLGATYVKLGQFVASSPSLFPKEYVVEFQKCLDATEPIEWSVIEKIIETEIGGPTSTAYASIEKEPLASASIAQVHRAKLKTGEDVVIKVQKPRIDSVLKADLNFIYIASRVLEFLQPDFERTSLSAIAGDIKVGFVY